MNVDVVLNRALRLIVPAAALAAAALAVFAVVERLALDQRAAERSALNQRSVTLTASALAPGSPLSCLDAGAGETTEAACEAAIFGSPQSTAAAVAYVGARLTLIADAQRFAPATDEAAGVTDGFAAARRALELDRFGIAAHVLAARDGCTPERCAAFAFLTDTTALKANMKAWAFDQYVSRHAAAWSAPAPAPAAVSQAPAAAPAGAASAAAASAAAASETASVEPHAGELVAHPLSAKYDFPSAASIPPVSIMNTEPKLPKNTAAAQASEFKADNKTTGAGAEIPVPPKRPQVPGGQAAPSAQVR